MKFSYNWLKELVDGLDTGAEELSRLITMKTAESEGVEHFGAHFANVRAAAVTAVEQIAGSKNVKVLRGYLKDHYQNISANALVAVNVLEHVEDDAEFLREAFSAIVPGGHLLLFVPATPAIYGSLDKVFEHHRRYTRATLRSTIEKAGWIPRRITYMNLPGIAAWFMAGRILRKTSIAPNDAKAYDRLMIPWISRLEALMPPPIGSNLIAIATRP